MEGKVKQGATQTSPLYGKQNRKNEFIGYISYLACHTPAQPKCCISKEGGVQQRVNLDTPGGMKMVHQNIGFE